MEFTIRKEGKFEYIEEGDGEQTIICLHGLFGALSNFTQIVNDFKDNYRVVVPLLPIFELPVREVTLEGLLDHVNEFISLKNYQNLHVVGNSLGGHIALLFVLGKVHPAQSLTITGSSGLFESAMGSTFPKRGDYEYIKQKVLHTFYDPAMATKEVVDEVYDIVNDRNKAIRIIATAKSAIRHNLEDKMGDIKIPTLIIWGEDDNITPPFVATKFDELIGDSELKFIPKCGHAPMMEHSEAFNNLMKDFYNSRFNN
jgi:pimeloyl-ACP methyl ester carboxylesterase